MDIKKSTRLFRDAPDFPLRVLLEENQAPMQPHQHEYVELVCVYDGEGTHVIEGRRIPLTQGDIFVIPRGISHGYLVAEKLSIRRIRMFGRVVFSTFRVGISRQLSGRS